MGEAQQDTAPHEIANLSRPETGKRMPQQSNDEHRFASRPSEEALFILQLRYRS